MIEHAAMAGFISVGCNVTKLAIASTPAVAVMARQPDVDAGIVITASHNPIIWNGIKIIRGNGMAPTAQQVQQIIDIFRSDDIDYAPVDQLQSVTIDTTAPQTHVDRVLEHIDVDAIRTLQLKVVLDSVNGAGGPESIILFNRLGIKLIHLNAQPTGIFPHPPEPTQANLTGLCDAVKKHNAHIGFAQDPDADRLAVVDENGTYIGEEYTLVLAAMHVLAHTPGTATTNLSTSRMIDDVANTFNSSVTRTAVGEANVAITMQQTDAVIGGEGNGGVILPQVSFVRDSLVAIALILELIATTNKTPSQLASSTPAYAILKNKLPITHEKTDDIITHLQQQYADQQIDLQDGIRIDFDNMWIHVRPSNTEPIIRVCGEATNHCDIEKLAANIRNIIQTT